MRIEAAGGTARRSLGPARAVAQLSERLRERTVKKSASRQPRPRSQGVGSKPCEVAAAGGLTAARGGDATSRGASSGGVLIRGVFTRAGAGCRAVAAMAVLAFAS